MDDEDLREAEEARSLHTTDNFAGLGSTATDPNRVASFMDVFRVSGETMGVKLLKKMGWKEGQGIGPKVRRRAQLDDRDDPGGETYLFAPENSPMISFNRKDDHKGLGFQGEARLQPPPKAGREIKADDDEDDNQIFSGPKLPMSKSSIKKHKLPKRGGFGIGILNDTGSDDEDPYGIGPQLSYNRVLGGDRKPKASKPALKSSNPLLETKPVFISKKTATEKAKLGFRKCHDGRLPIDGFLLGGRLSTLSLAADQKKYAPPEIPKDWKPSKQLTALDSNKDYVSVADAAKSSTLNPKLRAAILGEAQLPGKSVFDYMTPESRERLVKATGRTDLPPALGEGPPKGYETSETQKQKDLWSFVPHLDTETAIQALNRGAAGWMPYSEDELKRGRYRAFLELKAGITNDLPSRAPKASTDEWITELNEFARAAEVFKPVSGLMASRFTSSTSHPHSSSNGASTTESLLKRPEPKPEDPAEAAAKLGLYGPLTRQTIPFAPTRLLYKRFNIRFSPTRADSGSGAGTGEAGEVSNLPSERNIELVSKDTMNKLMSEARIIAPSSTNTASELQSQQSSNISNAQVDPDRNEVLEASRPGDAVFKAIFGSDNEDDDELD